MQETNEFAVFKQAFRRRLRFVSLLTLAGDVALVAILVWLYLAVGSPAFWWIPFYVALVVPASSALLVWAMDRSGKRMMRFVDALRPRLRGAPPSLGRQGYWFLFDNGVAMGIGQQPNALAFRVFGSPLGDPVRPTPDTLATWGRSLQLRGATVVTSKSGDPTVRDGVERFRITLRARWARVYLFARKQGSGGTAGGPAWVLVFLAFVPRFTERGTDVLNALDALVTYMDDSLVRLVAASRLTASRGG